MLLALGQPLQSQGIVGLPLHHCPPTWIRDKKGHPLSTLVNIAVHSWLSRNRRLDGTGSREYGKPTRWRSSLDMQPGQISDYLLWLRLLEVLPLPGSEPAKRTKKSRPCSARMPWSLSRETRPPWNWRSDVWPIHVLASNRRPLDKG
jgi:hypothetical protein